MRFRGKSIRRKIVALLVVPLVSLAVIWGVTTVVTGRAADRLLSASTVVEEVGFPIEDTVRVLQEERRATLVYLADPRASEAPARLHEQRDATNAKVAEVRANAENPDVREEMSGETAHRLDSLIEAFDGIDTLRRTVEDGSISAGQALTLYNRLIDPCHTFLSGLDTVNDVPLDKEGQALVDLARTREFLARQDALVSAVLVRGRVDAGQQRQMADYRARRELRSEVSLELLPASERERFERYWSSPAATPLLELEKNVVEGSAGTPRGITSATWDKAAKTVLDDLAELNSEAGDRYQERVEPEAVGVLLRAGAAGVLGLFALLFSIVLSVRIGRELIRDLSRLRKDAHEVSGVRLPSVMRRLAAGEQVDVETEAPRLQYEKDEMGQVGQALNTLQRAAVEAAVKQADMRRGVSEVFVNLARRSQVLLHKQLTLLDAMERRTEDTEELADLFRLDHLTTRMRRHAEGLVILSGAAPSRQWRKPVPLMDVVRAAVAEVEDYERIEVRRLARIAVTGPAVADLTHLVAELLENATVFSPPHTAVQVHGERVANGFTLEIHDRGLGMTPDALLDANLRLAETPEFELSDTDRLGLYVVSRLAQRQNVRVSLQPSPYGGTTAVVFVPDVLLTAAPDGDTSGGIRLDRAAAGLGDEASGERGPRLTKVPAQLPGLPKSVLESAVLDGPVELEAPVDAAERVRALDLGDLGDLGGLGDIEDTDSERGGLFRPRRKSGSRERGRSRDRAEHQQAGDGAEAGDSARPDAAVPVPLPRRRAPKLVSSHGRPVGEESAPAERPDERVLTPREELRGGLPAPFDARAQSRADNGDAAAERGTPPPDPAVEPVRDQAPEPVRDQAPEPVRDQATEPVRDQAPGAGRGGDAPAGPGTPASEEGQDRPKPAPYEDIPTAALPRRVRQANLAPQLKGEPKRKPVRDEAPADRDAEEVRDRMAALQRGWQRGRRDNGELENGERPAPERPAPERRAPERPAPGQPAPGQPAPERPAPEPPAPEPPVREEPRPGTAEDGTAHRTTEGDGR
ncbi:nitrate- and nitrite sensing domain-containing protein [Streptomyces sp. LHD-70]|uniref:nitrate- and nitrite sensing domain-containing protein n=1 Tax=Streptomyces sp. LHD-70 TaxID=3072140 RepID=UPI00280E3AE7|nr:nitrate- and nitrite sensing domain-containing protein [Streptomyces sp. LHD-70]MDQ8703400.1 nitrate- and nitrite sensing domain-containing protein [Streptomyces sp. LHD-70]